MYAFCLSLTQTFAQAFDINRSVTEIGLLGTVLVVVLGAFLIGVRHLIWKAMPEQMTQMREDHKAAINQLRADHKEDREQDRALINMQRTEFLAALKSVTENQAATFRDAIVRIERHLEALTLEVKKLNGQGGNGEGRRPA